MGVQDFRRHYTRERFITLSLIIIVLMALVIFDLPALIISLVGPERVFLGVFLVAAIGGVSALTSASYYGMIIGFAAEGLNPFLLGLAGGAGATIGDSLFFFFGSQSRVLAPKRVERIILRLNEKMELFGRWAISAAVFVYASFTPFPNEFMTIPLGVGGVKYRFVGPPLLAGNIVVTTLVCLVTAYGLSFF